MIGLAWFRNILRRPRPPQQLRRVPVCFDSTAYRDQLVHELSNAVAREFDQRSLRPELFFVGFISGEFTVACTRLRPDVRQVLLPVNVSEVLTSALKVHIDRILLANSGGAA